MSWGIKNLFGISKSSDKIRTHLTNYLLGELNINGFTKLYSEVIEKKKNHNPIFTGESDKVTVFTERIRFLIHDVKAHRVMIKSVYHSMEACNDVIPKILELRKALEDFGIIFDKYLEIQLQTEKDQEVLSRLEKVRDCLGDTYRPQNWSMVYRLLPFEKYETGALSGGRSRRRRKVKAKARKTRRS